MTQKHTPMKKQRAVMTDKIWPIKRSDFNLIALIPEDCEITAMCDHSGMLFIATDKNSIYVLDPDTHELSTLEDYVEGGNHDS